MRRLLPVVIFFAWAAAPAHATPVVSVQATPATGAAPLDVTLAATGDAVSYHWDLGDHTQADGAVVQHRYGAGRFTATVTAIGADGTTAQASVVITSVQLTVAGPKVGTYGRNSSLRGRMVPALRGSAITLYSGAAAVSSTRTDSKGRFRFRVRPREPATYTAQFDTVPSAPLSVGVRPGLDVAVPRAAMVGRPLRLRANLRPRGSGALSIQVLRDGKLVASKQFGDQAVLPLSTTRPAGYTIRLAVAPTGTFSARTATVHASVFLPYLAEGARGPSVRILERRLAELHYLLRGVDTYFSYDTADAVVAFQKVNGLARTGRVTPAVWRRLEIAKAPRPRYRGGRHFEVDKSRQVLFEVDHGHVIRVVHVSTGATGNTPDGRWHIYSKVPGTLPSGMFDSNFFLRGFAIHGYPYVPAYPASHGCVRIPNWAAPILFASSYYGETVDIYY